MPGPFRPQNSVDDRELDLQNLFIKKQNRVKGDVLRKCRNIFPGRKMRQKGAYLADAHILQMPLFVKKNIVADVTHVSSFGFVT